MHPVFEGFMPFDRPWVSVKSHMAMILLAPAE